MFNADTIIVAAIKAIGLDPVQTRNQLVALQNWVIDSMKNLDSRMRAVESDREAMHAKLDRILQRMENPQNELVILEKDENGTDEQSSASIHAIADGRERVANAE